LGDLDSYRELVEFHLRKHGTRPDGSPLRPGKIWQYEEFARTAGIASRTLRSCRRLNVASPSTRNSIERALFGENEGYTDWKIRLRRAGEAVDTIQKRAGRRAVGSGGETETNRLIEWIREQITETVGLAKVVLHPPTPGNPSPGDPDRYIVNATLGIGIAERPHEGQTYLIGLKSVGVRLTSEDWTVAKRTMFGDRTAVDGVTSTIAGPEFSATFADALGCLASSDLLKDDFLAVIEQIGDGPGEKPVIVSLSCPPRGFKFNRLGADGMPISPDAAVVEKDAILNTMISLKRRNEQGHVVVAEASMKRKRHA
jgi:hypothetical protein